MQKLIIASLMLLGLAVSASGQYRVVRLNSSEVKGQGLKADAIVVSWDDGEGRHRWSSISLEGQVKFLTEDGSSFSPRNPVGSQDGRLSRDALHYFPADTKGKEEVGDTILGHPTILIAGQSTLDPRLSRGEISGIEAGQSVIHFSRELGTDLKIVNTRDDTVATSEAVFIDQKADFDPRTAELSAVEQAAASAEAAGQPEYAKEIRRLVRRWRRAAANWP